MPAEKYAMIGPYSLFWKRRIHLVLLAEIHTPFPCETVLQAIDARLKDYNGNIIYVF